MSDDKSYTPDWAAEQGIKDSSSAKVKKIPAKTGKKSALLSVEDYVKGVLKNDRTVLARAITLVESSSPGYYKKAREVLKRLLPHSGQSLRIGITGIPGGGKSTLIETLGCFLIEKGHKIAVLAVDPSSTVTRGSILGDKTRMEKLSRLENCFIRPSPSGGTLGGVTRKTRETILACEAAGFDVILVETVGVGQSEVTVRSMVDFFLLVMIPGAGDELQGLKRGIIELIDALVVNKADGPNKPGAARARNQFALALKYIAPASKGWETRAYTCSAKTGEGIPEIWETITQFRQITKKSGAFEERRQNQLSDWVFSMIENELKENFYNHPRVREQLPLIKEKLFNGNLLPTTAAESLLRTYYSSKK